MTSRVLASALAFMMGSASIAAAQDLKQVRELYESAAYEDALKALEAAPTLPTETAKYRALCLLALGREEEALAEIERLVKENPSFTPSPTEISPKTLAVFNEVRTRVLPDIIKGTYAEAKSAYEAADRKTAHAAFQRTIDLIETLPEESRGPLDDLRMLAGEFLELTAPRPEPPPEPKPAVPETPKVEPLAEYREPEPINEALPAWNPPDPSAARREYVGLLRVVIGTDGRVDSARMLEGSHPMYDAAALRVAKQWTYKPATRDGKPITASRDIRIRLVPR